MTDFNVDDAPQGVAPAEPVAQPDTIAPAPGQGEETAPPNEGEPAAKAEGEPEKPPRAAPWWHARLEKQRQEIEALRQRAQGSAQQPQPPAETAPEQPLTRADVDRLANERAQQIAEVQTFNADCNSIAAAGNKAFPDFGATIAELNRVGQITPALIEAVKEAGDPAAVLYQLGKDPDEAARVLALSPARMGAALAKLAARPVPTPAVSKAPAPLAPIIGSGRVETDPEKMDMAQYMKWRDAQDAKKR